MKQPQHDYQSYGLTYLHNTEIGLPSVITIERRNSCHGPEALVIAVQLPDDYPGGPRAAEIEEAVKKQADLLNQLAQLNKTIIKP